MSDTTTLCSIICGHGNCTWETPAASVEVALVMIENHRLQKHVTGDEQTQAHLAPVTSVATSAPPHMPVTAILPTQKPATTPEHLTCNEQGQAHLVSGIITPPTTVSQPMTEVNTTEMVPTTPAEWPTSPMATSLSSHVVRTMPVTTTDKYEISPASPKGEDVPGKNLTDGMHSPYH